MNRRFFPVLMAYFLDNFGLAIVYPIFTPLILDHHLSLLEKDFTLFQGTFFLGLLIASFPLARVLGGPLFGALSDRLGRKKVFLFTLIGGILGYLLTGLGLRFKEIHLLWGGRIVAGFFAGNLTLCLASIADVSKQQAALSRNFGLVGTIGGLSFVIAILSAGALATLFHPDFPFLITGLLLIINLFLMMVFFKEKQISHSYKKHKSLLNFKNIWKAICIKEARVLYIVYFLFMMSWFASIQFLSAYLIEVYPSTTPKMIALVFALLGLTWSGANFLLNPLLTRYFPPTKIFLMGLVFVGIFFFLTLFPHQSRLLFVTYFLFVSLFAALSWTNGLVILSASGNDTIQGSLFGINQSIVSFALIAGSLVGSLLAGIDIHKLYFFTSCVSFFAAFLFSRKGQIII